MPNGGGIRWVGGVAFVCENEREARELGVWGRSPQRGPGAEPLGADLYCAWCGELLWSWMLCVAVRSCVWLCCYYDIIMPWLGNGGVFWSQFAVPLRREAADRSQFRFSWL